MTRSTVLKVLSFIILTVPRGYFIPYNTSFPLALLSLPFFSFFSSLFSFSSLLFLSSILFLFSLSLSLCRFLERQLPSCRTASEGPVLETLVVLWFLFCCCFMDLYLVFQLSCSIGNLYVDFVFEYFLLFVPVQFHAFHFLFCFVYVFFLFLILL